VRFEATTGVPPAALRALVRERPTVLAVHDFGLLWPRPEDVLGAGERAADLAGGGGAETPPELLAETRGAAREALEEAAAVVFPSRFLRDRYRELLHLERARCEVIEPAPPLGAVAGPTPAARAGGGGAAGGPGRPLRHLAFVGLVHPSKGADLFAELVRAVGRRHPQLRWSVLGGGDRQLLPELRRLPGVRVRGYYRSGALPRLLQEEGVDLALLLSRVPESYCLTLDECVRAGVPVLAFAAGALADRVPRHRAGVVVPSARGVAGLAEELEAMLAGATPRVPVDAAADLPTPRSAAAAWADLLAALAPG
jgi:glycosyltransferase involved in cell wall biosynthesis